MKSPKKNHWKAIPHGRLGGGKGAAERRRGGPLWKRGKQVQKIIESGRWNGRSLGGQKSSLRKKSVEAGKTLMRIDARRRRKIPTTQRAEKMANPQPKTILKYTHLLKINVGGRNGLYYEGERENT